MRRILRTTACALSFFLAALSPTAGTSPPAIVSMACSAPCLRLSYAFTSNDWTSSFDSNMNLPSLGSRHGYEANAAAELRPSFADTDFRARSFGEWWAGGATSAPSSKAGIQQDATVGLSLVAAVNLAVERSPEVHSSRAQLDLSHAELQLAQSALYPQIGYFGAPSASLSNGTASLGTVGLTVNQLVYDFGRTDAQVASKRSAASMREIQIEEKLEDITRRTADAFIEQFRAQRARDVARLEFESMEKLREVIKLRSDAGVSNQSDLVMADIRLVTARANQVTVNTTYEAAKIALASLTGRNNTVLVDPQNIFDSLTDISGVSISNNAALRAAEHALQAARDTRRALVSEYLPTVGIEARAGYDFSGGNSAVSTELRLNISGSLYSGGAGEARVSAGTADERAAAVSVEILLQSLIDELQTAERQIEASTARAAAYSEQILQAQAVKDLYFEEYTLGKRSLFELLGADSQIFESMTAKTNAECDVWRQIARRLSIGNSLRTALETANI